MSEALDVASYAQGWVRRARALGARLAARREELRGQAVAIAGAIRERWPEARVHLLGSVLDPDTFRMDSDLDLVVEGVSAETYWEAWAVAEPLARGTRLDFIRFETAAPALRELVRAEGEEL